VGNRQTSGNGRVPPLTFFNLLGVRWTCEWKGGRRDFEVASDLAFWRAEVPGKVSARAEGLTGPMTPPGQRVQLLNAPGSEVGPGQVATWGKATTHRVDAVGLKWEADGTQVQQAHPLRLVGPRALVRRGHGCASG
jgi:hypothetical protein